MRRSREIRNVVRKVGVLGAIVLAGALVGISAGFGGDEVGYTADASTLARQMQRQVERGAGTGRGAAPILIAAGDIADCGTRGDSATAALVRDLPGTVATLGDHVYDSGTK